MGYIKSKEHFVNYLVTCLRRADPPIRREEVFPADWYISQIYDKGHADQFTWDLKQKGAEIIKAENVVHWVDKCNMAFFPSYEFAHAFTDDFLMALSDLEGKSGVYSFWFGGKSLYIGKSKRLHSRPIESFNERFSKVNQQIEFRYIVTVTQADASILEIHFINTLKPIYNTEHKDENAIHKVKIIGIPQWSDPIICNQIEEYDNE